MDRNVVGHRGLLSLRRRVGVHYLLTFTLPQQLQPLARAHQQRLYSMLLQEAAATVQTLAHDRRWVGGTPAILAVLHTWSRTLDYHRHAHLLVSAGGLSDDGTTWIRPAQPRFLMPGYALSEIFRAKMRTALARASLLQPIDTTVWDRPWNVHVQQIGTGEQATLYLSRYIYHVALSNHRLVRFDQDQVTFRYTHARTHDDKQLTLPVHDFIARFLQHVLPRGFAKVRSYGLLSPSRRKDLERARLLLEAHAAAITKASDPESTPSDYAVRDARLTGDILDNRDNLCRLQCPLCQQGQLLLIQRLPRPRAPP